MSFKLKKLLAIDMKTKEEITIPSASPVSVYLEFAANEIPKVKLTLSVPGNKLYKYKYYKCIITFSDDSSTDEFDFFVDHIDEANSAKTVLTGLMCNQEQATVYKSNYLGNTIKEAVNQLGFNRKLISFDKPSVNFDYFQFNETANDALLKILIGNSPYSYGFITDKFIGTKDFSNLEKLDKGSFKPYQIKSTDNLIYVDNMYDVKSTINDNKVKFKSIAGTNSFDIHQASVNGESIIYDFHCPQELNAMCNRHFMGTLNKSIYIKSSNPLMDSRPNIGDVILFKGFNYFNTSDEGFPAVITKHVIYEGDGVTKYSYIVERV